MELKVRRLDPPDIPLCASIVRRSFATVAEEFGLTLENAATNGAFLEDSRLLGEYERGFVMFGLLDGDTQIGFTEIEANDGVTYYLEKLAVLPERRHLGGGKLLMDHAVDFIRTSAGEAISIGVIHENTQLVRWYEAYGFELTGTKVFPHLPFTVGFMRLGLA